MSNSIELSPLGSVLTQSQMIRSAQGYNESLCSSVETDSSFIPSDAVWKHVPNMDIEKLAKKYFSSPADALSWILEEIQIFTDDGILGRADDFKSMIKDGIQEEIIIGNGVKDGLAMWDGMHRLAAAFSQGYRCPAIIGTKLI